MHYEESTASKIHGFVSQFRDPKMKAVAESIAQRHMRNGQPVWANFEKEARAELRRLAGLKSTTPPPVSRDAWQLMTPKEQRDHVMAGGQIE